MPSNSLTISANDNNNVSNVTMKNGVKKQVVVGSTWAGSMNIDLDNLMEKKEVKGTAPTMNQLKSSVNSSPVHQQATAMFPTSSNDNFMSMTSNVFNQSVNNNNINQFNTFQ